MTANNLLKKGSEILKKNHIKTHLLDSELILSNLTGKSRENFLINSNIKISKDQVNNFNNLIMRRALKKEPIAFLLKYKEFWSTKFNVQKGVLIPRPETEELTKWILEDNKGISEKKRVIDIATGSGCIAITLSFYNEYFETIGVDISKKALNVCEINKKRISSNTTFMELDIREEKIFSKKFDIIVSNPPYLTKNENLTIGKNVKFEPQIALFAPSKDPLLYYKKIINFSKTNLNKNGFIYFEINPIYIKEINKILAENNLNDVNFRDDFRGKKRFLKITIK